MAATIQEIGRALNLSHTTVSRVINRRNDQLISEATRERVLKAAREMGYRPHRAARALVTGRTNQVAIWMRNLSSAFDAQVMRGLLLQMHHDGYQAVIGIADLLKGGDFPLPSARQSSVLPEMFGSVDGCLVFEAAPQLIPLILRSAAGAPPLVALGGAGFRSADMPEMDYVGVDLAVGVESALEHLIGIGCRRIAFVGACRAEEDEPRMATYLRIMATARRPAELVRTAHHSRADARNGMQEHMAAHGCPDGLLCFNDDVALGAYRAVRDAGLRIPEDVALIGHDGIEDTEYLSCPISTLVQPVEQMTELAWRYLLRRIENPEIAPQQSLLRADLVLRGSTDREAGG